LIKSLDIGDAKWATRRVWFHDLSRFDLGDNFFEKVFHTNEHSPPDKRNFTEKTLANAQTFIESGYNSIHEKQKELGFAIEGNISEKEKQEHESLLGYEWWLKIYNAAKRKNQFSKDQIIELENKRKYLLREINRIELLSK